MGTAGRGQRGAAPGCKVTIIILKQRGLNSDLAKSKEYPMTYVTVTSPNGDHDTLHSDGTVFSVLLLELCRRSRSKNMPLGEPDPAEWDLKRGREIANKLATGGAAEIPTTFGTWHLKVKK